jgi:XisI protein
MDKLSHYRSAVKQVLSQHAEHVPSHGQIETIPVFDERNENYLLLDLGWDRTGRVMPLCSIYVSEMIKYG